MSTETGQVKIKGLAISPGLGLGTAVVYRDILQREHEEYDLDEHEVEEEYSRIQDATRQVRTDLRSTAATVEQQMNRDVARIFAAQEAMLEDPSVLGEMKEELEDELINAEQVVHRVLHRWEKRFRNMDDPYLRERADDIADISRRLLRVLTGIHAHTLEDMPDNSILVARRLLPSDTVFLSRSSTLGVVLELGGTVCHAAILTRELGVPAVSQIPGLTDKVQSGQTVAVDGCEGTIIIQPSNDTQQELRHRMELLDSAHREAVVAAAGPAVTATGVRIQVLANVGCADDIRLAAENGADGVGLYRTESFYLARKLPPSEDELVSEMQASLAPIGHMPVCLRLLDAGSDKNVPTLSEPSQDANPALGRRGIRRLLQYPDLLRVQLRAFTRLSQDFDLSILVPMVSLASEMAHVAQALATESRALGIGKPPLGAMVETPAAALSMHEIVCHSDFVSVGTNDLTQYTFAADRENPAVSEYFLDDHPAVRRLLRMVYDGARDLPVSVCGELGANTDALPQLVRIGIRAVSVAPPLIPEVKACIRALDAELLGGE